MPWRRRAGAGSVDPMSAPLSMTSADIETPDASHEAVAIHVKASTNTVRITKGLTVIEARDDVVDVYRVPGKLNARRVTFKDGTEWIVTKSKKGCKPCGR